jgi:hypothetical protein
MHLPVWLSPQQRHQYPNVVGRAGIEAPRRLKPDRHPPADRACERLRVSRWWLIRVRLYNGADTRGRHGIWIIARKQHHG